MVVFVDDGVRVSLTVAAFVVGAVGLASSGAGAIDPVCSHRAETSKLRLPAAVRVVTGCATYVISPTGAAHASNTPRLVGGGISWMAVAGVGAPVRQEGANIAVLDGGRIVWRSHGRFRAVGVFATVGPSEIAFSDDSYGPGGEEVSLYLARFGGAERRVGMDEHPLGWTARGQLLSWRFQHGLSWMYLRDRSGRLLRRVSGGLHELRFDPVNRTVLAISRRGLLERYQDGRWSPVANLALLGLDGQPSFERLPGNLIGVLEGRRVVVLRVDGSVFGSARFRVGNVAGESGLISNPAGTAVGFVVTDGTPGAASGRESVELLRAGDREATVRYSARVPLDICERWVTLAWHRGWLLYAVPGGKTLLLDTATSPSPLDLTGLVHELAPHNNVRSIAWA